MGDTQPLPRRKRGTPKVDPRMRKKDPIKTIPKTAAETIFKAILLKLDLMKDSKDGKQSKDGLPIRNGELKDLISGDSTREYVAEATRLGNERRDIDEEFKKRYGFKNTPKNWKRGRKNRMSGGTKESLKSQAEETVFKAISLKLDLMKVSSFKGSPKLPKISNVKLNTSTNNWNDSKVDPDDYENGKPIDWAKRNAEQFQHDRDEEDANYYDSLEYDDRD